MAELADTSDAQPFCINWIVDSLFLPYGKVEAVFRQKFPVLTEWKASLRPRPRIQRDWKMIFSLQAVRPDEDEYVVSVDRMMVEIDSEEESFETIEQDESYSFHAGNEYTFQMAPFTITPGVEIDIRIGLFFPRIEMVPTFQLEMSFNLLDGFSKRFQTLLTSEECSDLELWSAAPQEVCFVHSCVIAARWDNFFTESSSDPSNPRSVETNISSAVLKDIVTYMYTGGGAIFEWDDKSEEYKTELLQVMDKYHLHHLYKNFTIDPLVRVFRTSVGRHHCHKVFRLNRIGHRRYAWNENPMPGVEIRVSVLFHLNDEDCNFFYWLNLLSGGSQHARVKVELEDEDQLTLLQEDDFELNDVESTGLHSYSFEGDLRSFVSECRLANKEPSPAFHFDIYFTDGVHVTESIRSDEGGRIQSLAGTFPPYFHNIEVLSDHMHRLMLQRWEGDLEVEWPIDSDISLVENLHKAIFVAGLPGWRNVVAEDAPENVEIPNRVRCGGLRSQVFRHIIPVLYTGRCDPVPNDFHHEVLHFARRGGNDTLVFILNLDYFQIPRL